MDPAGRHLDRKQDVQSFQEDRIQVKKSTASTPFAWARRNHRHVTADRAGAGSTPAQCRMVHMVLAPSLHPSRHSVIRL